MSATLLKMSTPSHNPNASPGKATQSSKLNLLTYMKLRSSNDINVHEKISEWVELQQLPSRIPSSQSVTCRIASALLLQRLVRAFEQRLNSSVDDSKKKKGSNASPSKVSNINAFGSSDAIPNGGRNDFSKKSNQPSKSPAKTKPLADLNVLMQRKVKVTRLVQQAVQFVGSDVLKVLQVLAHSLTVSDVATACLTILKDVSRIKSFYRIFAASSGKDPLTVDQASSVFFGVFALQALQSLRAQATSSFQLAHDFDWMYRTCYQHQNFQACMDALNPITVGNAVAPSFAPDTEARNICWKIARVLVLKLDYESKSDPETKDHRRNHILSSAASIVLAANMGKSMMAPTTNGKITEATSGSASLGAGKLDSLPAAKRHKASTSNEIDFVSLVGGPVSDLLHFLSKNTYNSQGITPIYKADIRSHLEKICTMINQLPVVIKAASNTVTSRSTNLPPLLSKTFAPAKLHFVLNNYRSIIHTLVMDTQKELKINTAANSNHVANSGSGTSARTGIVNVLLLFPMVIGEPWGIHRDAPIIASKTLCLGEYKKPSLQAKDSVAVVMKLKPKQVARKPVAGTSESPAITKKITTDPIEIIMIDAPPPATRPPKEVKTDIVPPVINDSTELNEWTLSILSLSVVRPSDSLLTYLGEHDRMQGNGSSCLEDVIVPVLNRGVQRIQGALRSFSNAVSEDITTKLTVGRRDGQVYVNGKVDHSIQLCASVVGFYYHSLEAIIHDQMNRMEFLGTFDSLLQSGSFHRALLACCYTCVLKGVCSTQKLHMNKNYKNITVQILMDTIESNPFTFLKVVEALCRALIGTNESSNKQLGSPIVAGIPIILQTHIQKIESQLVDSLVWNSQSSTKKAEASLVSTIKTMKSLPGAWPPDVLEPILPEEIINGEGKPAEMNGIRYKPSFGASSEANFFSFLLRKLLKCAFSRIQAISAALNMSNETLVHTQILVAFRYLLRHHITIFNERHVDQLLLCSVYGVCRMMKVQPEITFAKIIDAYLAIRGEEQGERACRLIVRHIKLASSENENRNDVNVVGNLVVFYNQLYVPMMQKYFLGSRSLKQSSTMYQKRLATQRIAGNKEQKQNAPKKRKVDDGPSQKSLSITASSDSVEMNSKENYANKSSLVGDRSSATSVENTGESFSGPPVAFNSANAKKKVANTNPDDKKLDVVNKTHEGNTSDKDCSVVLDDKQSSDNPKQLLPANNSEPTLKSSESPPEVNGLSAELKEKVDYKTAPSGDGKCNALEKKSTINSNQKSSNDTMEIDDSKNSAEEDKMEVDDSFENTSNNDKMNENDLKETPSDGKSESEKNDIFPNKLVAKNAVDGKTMIGKKEQQTTKVSQERKFANIWETSASKIQ